MNYYGCRNRPPFLPTLTVFDGYTDDTRQHVQTKEIPFRMNPDCQFTKTAEGQADDRCNGCNHRLEVTL